MNYLIQNPSRDELGQIAYQTWKERLNLCWPWEQLDVVSQEAWKDVGEAVRDASLPVPVQPRQVPGLQM